MCLFEDEMKPPSANLQSGLISLTCSKRSYTTTLSIRRRNTSRKAASHCSNYVAAMAIVHIVIQSEAWESPK